MALGTATQNNVALATLGKPFAELTADQQASATAALRRALQGVGLTRPEVVLPAPLADALARVRVIWPKH